MWQIDNKSPFGVCGNFLRDRHGGEFYVIAVRATLAISSDGQLDVHGEQMQPLSAPNYDGHQQPELLDEADFAPFRPNVDVILSGEVQPSADRKPFAMFGFRLGTHEKFAIARPTRRICRVNGAWRLLGEGPLRPIGLSWRESLGGVDPLVRPDGSRPATPFNPIGRGWIENPAEAPEGLEFDLPSVEGIGSSYDPRKALPAPIGFGPIPAHWEPRVSHAGTYDDKWRTARMPLVPTDFSESFHQAVPTDQVYRRPINGGEPFHIYGMHPDWSYAFRIPKIIFRGKTKISREWHSLDFCVIGVKIEATKKLLHLIWNASVPCTGADHLVEISTVTVDKIGGLRLWPNLRRTSAR